MRLVRTGSSASLKAASRVASVRLCVRERMAEVAEVAEAAEVVKDVEPAATNRSKFGRAERGRHGFESGGEGA
ncbi:hypothetical protein Svir_05550 [Saccharomonospora viridis DSM 43017]|uniref:Uncharacterized protein n=1 Tax=Saccharomonospora viridis (strain ATCC 15386 / DSM 43017 / JCM 3036 / CCUG 5913 / NBRC 12207 / NCIMB 9602 / P101) TaxID=471857 RepID=C7MUR6_SACVD|nr:hypothetical protein Svir_05550 [Saccharomonospora viridis DSM 43017]